MDILNNLLLSKELKRKVCTDIMFSILHMYHTVLQEAMANHAHMKFALQLSSKVKDPRKAVLSQQNKVKYVCLWNSLVM